MNIENFNTAFQKVIANDFDPAIYLDIIEHLNSMSRPCVMATLNLAVSLMDEDEHYLEIGTHLGCSLISALYGNEKPAIAVDNFSQFAEMGNEEALINNLNKYGVMPRVEFRNEDFRETFSEELPKIGVYYYDANHSEEDTYLGLTLALPHLHKGTLVILDDYSFGTCRQASERFMKENPAVKRLFYVDGLSNNEHWWNGIGIFTL